MNTKVPVSSLVSDNKHTNTKYNNFGGVAGGATAAARIRRNTEKAEIILFERGEYISYANCGYAGAPARRPTRPAR